MYSIGRVLSIMPVSKVMDFLNATLAATFEEIQRLVNEKPVISSKRLLKEQNNKIYILEHDSLASINVSAQTLISPIQLSLRRI